jgi:hypothetical protein
MSNPEDAGREQREAETAEVKRKEGYGAVPNVPQDKSEGELGEMKEALHQVEEEKGDWAKDH